MIRGRFTRADLARARKRGTRRFPRAREASADVSRENIAKETERERERERGGREKARAESITVR